MNLLTFDATIFDEIAGRAVLQFSVLAATLATIFTDICIRRRRAHTINTDVMLGGDVVTFRDGTTFSVPSFLHWLHRGEPVARS